MTDTADRRQFLGGSEAAAILGLSKYGTPLSVFKNKKGLSLPPSAEQKKVFRRGHLLEPVILEIARQDHGVETVKVSTEEKKNYYVDSTHDFLACEIDFEFKITNEFIDLNPELEIDPSLIGSTQNGDCKSASQFVAGEFGEPGTDEVLVDHTLQAQHGMGIMDRQLTLFAVLFGGYNLSLYMVKRDDELITMMREKMVRFWHENILADKEPDPINMDDMRWMIARTIGHPVNLTPEMFEMLSNIEESRNAKKNTEEALDFQMFEIGKYVLSQWQLAQDSSEAEDARLFFEGRVVGTWNKQANGHFDSKSLKEAMPDVYAQYMRRSFHRVLRLKK